MSGAGACRVVRMRDSGSGAGRPRPPRVFLVAGGPPGDRLGAALMHALRAQAPGVALLGAGGSGMTAAGLAPPGEPHPSGSAGRAAALPMAWGAGHAGRIAREVLSARPDVLVAIDAPQLALRIARRVRRRRPDLPIVHYVLPTARAWPDRAARLVDRVLTLLPFEAALAEAAGLACDYVGHPVAEPPPVAAEAAARYRAGLGVRPDRPLVLMAPGSRGAQARRLLPLFRRTVEALAAERPGLAVIVPVAAGAADAVEAGLRGMTPAPHLVRPEAGERQKGLAMAAADAALVGPGRIALELADAGTPMVACTRAGALVDAIARRMRPVGTVNPVNLIAETAAVPEFHREQARPELVGPALAELLDESETRARQLATLAEVMSALGRGGDPPSVRAARSVLEVASRPAVAGRPTGG